MYKVNSARCIFISSSWDDNIYSYRIPINWCRGVYSAGGGINDVDMRILNG